MSISDKKFLEICEEFPAFHGFLCQRALTRRNYFKKIEKKLRENQDSIVLEDSMLNEKEY